jgi:AGZA family xanthine/uracil permease-like MFS transporter
MSSLTAVLGRGRPSGAPEVPIWTRGDLNAFFGFFINMLVNVIVLAGLCVFVVNIPAGDVNGTILPALGIELLVGNVFYFWLARRLAHREGRTDVTAMPYGPSVPHMFIVTLVIMLPIYIQTKDPVKAWEAGLAWAFIIGLIILAGAFVGPLIRRLTPGAALLGTLAGISITFISMRPAAQMWEALWIALPVLAAIIIGFISGVKLPFNIPIGLAALLVGTAIAWIGGYMDAGAVSDGVESIALAGPTLNLDMLLNGLGDISPLLATAIPLGIYNFTEAMSNVESAAVAGDSYNLRSVLLADGAGAVIGAGLGSPFPPAVYIGQPGWKAAGGRISYSLATGVLIFGLCVLGMFPLLSAILPIPAIVPILLFIGLAIGSQSFAAVPKAFYPAIVLAMIPNIAQWATGQVDNALAAAGTSAQQVGFENLATGGVIYEGLKTLGEGAVLAGMVLGAVAVFMINRNFLWAAGYSLFGAGLAAVGLIHGEEVAWMDDPQVVLGYAFMAAVCLAFYFLRVPVRELDPADPADTEAPTPDWRPARLGGGMAPSPGAPATAMIDEGPAPATTT